MAAEAVTVRIAARRIADGRLEVALQPQEGEPILPRLRILPAAPTVNRWLNSFDLALADGSLLGRISARRLHDGRTEFSFLPAGGERLLPSPRYQPAGGASGWLRSSAFALTPSH